MSFVQLDYKLFFSIMFSIILITGTIPLESYAESNVKQNCQTKTIKQVVQKLVDGKPYLKEESVNVVFCTAPPSQMRQSGCNMPTSGKIPWITHIQNGSKISSQLQEVLNRVISGPVCVIILLPYIQWNTEGIKTEYDLNAEYYKRVIQEKLKVVEQLKNMGVNYYEYATSAQNILIIKVPIDIIHVIEEFMQIDQIQYIGYGGFGKPGSGSYEKNQEKLEYISNKLHDLASSEQLIIEKITQLKLEIEKIYPKPEPQHEKKIELNQLIREKKKIDSMKENGAYFALRLNLPISLDQKQEIAQWKEQGYTYKSNSELEAERNTQITYMQQKILHILEENNVTIGRINDNYIEAHVPKSLIPKLESMDEIILIDIYGKYPNNYPPTSGYKITPRVQAKMLAGVEDILINLDFVSLNPLDRVITPVERDREKAKMQIIEAIKINTSQSPVLEFLGKHNLMPTSHNIFNKHHMPFTISSNLIPELVKLKEVHEIDSEYEDSYITTQGGGVNVSNQYEFVLDVTLENKNFDSDAFTVTINGDSAHIKITDNTINAINIPENAMGKDIQVTYDGNPFGSYEIITHDDDTQTMLLSFTKYDTYNKSISSPAQQLRWGIEPKGITCNLEHVLVLRDNGNPACITEKTFERISDRLNWILVK